MQPERVLLSCILSAGCRTRAPGYGLNEAPALGRILAQQKAAGTQFAAFVQVGLATAIFDMARKSGDFRYGSPECAA